MRRFLEYFEPKVILLTVAELRKAAAANPFKAAEKAPKSLHLFFLESKPNKPNFESMDRYKGAKEKYALKGTVFYFHNPDGIGLSKLAGRVERDLSVGATARNWKTVLKLIELTSTGK